jgi:hypothetical protein
MVSNRFFHAYHGENVELIRNKTYEFQIKIRKLVSSPLFGFKTMGYVTEKRFIKHYDTIYSENVVRKMPSLTSQLKRLTDEDLTRIRLQLIIKMLESDPKLKRILKLYLR